MAVLKYSRQREAIKNYLRAEKIIQAPIWYMTVSEENFLISVSEPFTEIFLINRAGRDHQDPDRRCRIVLMREWRRIIISYVRAADGSWTL